MLKNQNEKIKQNIDLLNHKDNNKYFFKNRFKKISIKKNIGILTLLREKKVQNYWWINIYKIPRLNNFKLKYLYNQITYFFNYFPINDIFIFWAFIYKFNIFNLLFKKNIIIQFTEIFLFKKINFFKYLKKNNIYLEKMEQIINLYEKRIVFFFYYKFWRIYQKQYDFAPISYQARRRLVFKTFFQKEIILNNYKYREKIIKSLAFIPRYLNYLKLFYNQFLEKQTFRKLFRFNQKQLIRHYRIAVNNSKRLFIIAFIKYFEFRLDTIAYRANFIRRLRHSRYEIQKGKIFVNGYLQIRPDYKVLIGDCIIPQIEKICDNSYVQQRLFSTVIQADQYPEYILFNERVPAVLIYKNPNIYDIKHILPISWEFISFSLLKYNNFYFFYASIRFCYIFLYSKFCLYIILVFLCIYFIFFIKYRFTIFKTL